MEIRSLRTFICVCETMNFTKAAERLGYSQTAVSMQMAQLESELGVNLFDRQGKRIQLNDKGRQLLDYAHRIMALITEAKSNVSDDFTPAGTLRLGVIESVCGYFLPEILEQYMLECPNVNVVVKMATTREIMEMLRTGQVDMILTLDDVIHNRQWECSWKRRNPIVYLCKADHPHAGKHITLKEFAAERIILTEEGCNYRNNFESFCAEGQLDIASFIEIGHTENILRYTENGLGVTFLPEICARKSLEEGRLREIFVEDGEIEMYLQLISRKDRWYSPAMKAFERVIKESENKNANLT